MFATEIVFAADMISNSDLEDEIGAQFGPGGRNHFGPRGRNWNPQDEIGIAQGKTEMAQDEIGIAQDEIENHFGPGGRNHLGPGGRICKTSYRWYEVKTPELELANSNLNLRSQTEPADFGFTVYRCTV